MAKVLGDLEIDNGNLGIGGAAASVTHGPHLDIVGNRGTITVGTGYFEDNGTTNFLNGARPLALGVSNTEYIRINTSGNVGIGTTSPSRKLDVDGIQGWQLSNLETAYLNPTSTGADFALKDSSNTNIIRFDSRPNAVSYLNGGNVGIGTTSPAAKLDVEAGDLGGTSGDNTTAAIIRAGRQNLIFQNTRTANGTDWNNATFKLIAAIDSTSHQSIDFVNDASYLEHIDIRVGNQAFSTRFASNGNVGIGTSSPDEKLHIVGDLKIDSDIPRIYLADSSHNPDYSIGNVNGSFFVLDDTNSAYRIYVNSAGNVGIGTNLPAGKLSVVDNTNTLQFAEHGSQDIAELKIIADAAHDAAIYFGDTVDNVRSGIYYDTSLNNMQFRGYNNATRMIIDSGGNVGIGTGSPTAFLSVASDATSSSDIAHFSNSNNVWKAKFRLDSNSGGELVFRDGSNNAKALISSSGNSYFNGGNVGIGTTSPAQKLDVSGQGAFSRNYVYGQSNYHIALNEDTETAYIGNVNGSPYISNASYYGSQIYNVTSTQTGIASVYAQSTGDILFLTSTFTAGAASTQQANTRMTVKGSGNVGIGTTTPDEKLHIVGDLKIDSDIPRIYLADSSHNPDYSIGNVNGSFFVLDDTNSAYRLYIDSAGKVGIGTNLPAALLDVNGTAQMSTGITENVHYVGGSIQHWGDSGTGLYFETDELRFYTGGAEEMRLENDGDLHVDGDVIAYSTTVSDERLKDDVKTIDSACEKVSSLRGVEYTWNSGSRKGQREIGVIAQEVEKVIPEIVREKKLALVDDEVYKTVDYEKLVAVLIEANKELQDRVSKLESKLDGITD